MTVVERQVAGIDEADFNTWKRHPVTKLYRKYLADYQGVLRLLHCARWEAGQTDQTFEAEARAQLRAIAEMETLTFEHIAAFYEEGDQPPPREESEDMNATQTTAENAG